MFDIQAKIDDLVITKNNLKAQLNAKRYAPVESGLNALKGILELIDSEYVPHFEKLNKGFILRVGEGRTINYNVGYPSFIYSNFRRVNTETIDTLLEDAKVEVPLWLEELVEYYNDINIALVETNLTKVLLEKISECELEITNLEKALAEE